MEANKKKNTKKIVKKSKKVNTKKMNIWEKLFLLQQTVAPVIKTGKNTHHSYEYAKEIDIIGEVKPVLKDLRLTYFFTTKNTRLVEADLKKRILSITFTLVNVDKPSETIPTDIESEGENKEGSVVGIPVAYTMALKYYFAKLCMLETGTDAEISEIQKKKGKGKEDPKNEETPEMAFEKAKNLIKSSRNISGLIDYDEKLKTSKFFKAEQKEELSNLIKSRVAELDK